MKRAGLLFISLFIGKIAFALPGYWDTGYGQGITEYTLENKDGRKVAISCNEDGSDYIEHGVDIYMKGHDGPIINEEEEYVPIEFVINNDSYDFPIETRSRSGSNEWYRLIDALSQASSFQFFWNGEFFGDFESKNTSKTIANLKDCKAMIDRDTDYVDDAPSAPKDNGFVENTMSQNPFKVNLEYVNDWPAPFYRVHVVSLENSIVLNNVVINRGNCRVGRYSQNAPVQLKYGQSMYVAISGTCNILEVDILTNKGSITYNFH